MDMNAVRISAPWVGAVSVSKADLAYNGKSGGHEVAVPAELVQAQLEPPRQQRRPRAERDRRDRDEHLVQQPSVGELTGEVSPADDPDVPVAGRRHELPVHRYDVLTGELDLRLGN